MRIEKGTIEDLDDLERLRLETSQWLKTEKGISQWSSAHPRELLENGFFAGEIFVVREEGRVVATVTLDQIANPIWGERMKDSTLYLHRLIVARSHAGRGLGRELIAWSENFALNLGFLALRLDCDSTNSKLCAFYREMGFQSFGVRFYPRYNMTLELFEKKFVS